MSRCERPTTHVSATELEGSGRKVVLFTTGGRQAARRQRPAAGGRFRGVMRLDEVRRVEKIPALGTGKTD